MATSWLPIPRRPRDDEEEIRLVQIPEIVSLKSSIYSPSFVQDDQPVSERPANEHTVPTPIMLPKGRTMSLNPRKTWTEWTTILSDCLTVLLPLALMLFVVVVASTDNKQIDSRFDDLINALTVLATAFPILFAFILGRLLYQMARLSLENGASLGTLEQLMGSRTLGASFATHFQLRLFNWHGLLLLSTWSLSPIGGQSLLRCLNIEPGSFRQTGFYFDTLNPVGVNTGLFFDNAAYSTALVSPQSIREGPMDLWGNVKIPFLDSLLDPDDEGWRKLNTSSTTKYSSLVGIPTSNIPAGNTTFSIESTYMRLGCSELESYPLLSTTSEFFEQETTLDDTLETLGMVNATTHLSNGTWYGHQHNTTEKHPRFWNLALDRFVDNCWWNGSHASNSDVFTPTFGVFESETEIEAGPTNLLFQARINLTSSDEGSARERIKVVKSQCRVLQEYVESSVDCSREAGSSAGTCRVVAQRKSKGEHPPEDLTSISQPMDFKSLSASLPKLIVSQNTDATTDPLLIYLYMNSLDELDRWESIPDLKTVEDVEFSSRLSQLINSYVVLSGASMAVIPQFFKSTVPNSGIKPGIKMTQTETTDLFYYYAISWPWMVACLFSCGVLLVGGIFSVIYAHSANGPEVLGFVSTSFRDSKYVSIPPGAEHVDGSKLSEMMKDERFQYGYMSDQDGVYRVGIAHEKNITNYG
ncbi:hypothetical protein B0J13DRAFT_538381 [Dactylonectria estremocensis]|uniref:Uncharacterized protein n=1 Tax=Dactylonectria estremocensis TaxID=1079267 RepID=A0A9P9FK53_9HYPO|nr:hypothetical protein B0J13DRAFT_538381 [Dactylonectria estremocensis]